MTWRRGKILGICGTFCAVRYLRGSPFLWCLAGLHAKRIFCAHRVVLHCFAVVALAWGGSRGSAGYNTMYSGSCCFSRVLARAAG